MADSSKCQIATTVTREGGSILEIGSDGEAGATVTLEPALAEDGPIYIDASNVPDKALTETTNGGGVLFANVPPGEYVMSAQKAGKEFGDVKVKCLPGLLVNASPPRGINLL